MKFFSFQLKINFKFFLLRSGILFTNVEILFAIELESRPLAQNYGFVVVDFFFFFFGKFLTPPGKLLSENLVFISLSTEISVFNLTFFVHFFVARTKTQKYYYPAKEYIFFFFAFVLHLFSFC